MLQDRRGFLSFSSSTFAALWLAGPADEVRAALAHASGAARTGAAWEFLTPEQAADVEAITSQILPSEPGSPGAREAGVVFFVDRGLATWAQDQREPFAKGLDELNAEVAKRWPGTARFAGLSGERQIELLKAREKTDFFGIMRTVTMLGTFGNPSYGGNRENLGWKLIGFQDQYAWQPPFGDYDAGVR